MSTERITSLALPAPDDRSPLEWSDEDEDRPFEIPQWRALRAQTLSPRTMSRHFLILGETGSGKTKSAIQPIIAAARRYGERYPDVAPAMLVIDPKFELTPLLRHDSASRVVPIDSAATTRRIRLFEGKKKGLDASEIVGYTLTNCSPTYVASLSSREPFWRNSAIAIIEAFVAADLERSSRRDPLWETLIRAAGERLRSSWTALGISPDNESKSYYENVYKLLGGIVAMNEYWMLESFVNICVSLGVSRQSLNFIGGLEAAPYAQRGGQMAEALLFLRDLTNLELNNCLDLRPKVPRRRRGLDDLCVRDALDDGKILTYCPASGSTTSDVIGRVLKTKFFEAAFTRTNKLRPVFYVCDEFHRYITADPESGEQSFLDRCRAYRVVCALATQSIASLRNGLQFGATNASGHLDSTLGVILSNTGNKFIFRTTDADTQDKLKKFIPQSLVQADPHVLDVHPLSTLSPGTCYFMFADGTAGRAAIELEGIRAGNTRARYRPIRLVKPLTIREVLRVCDRIEQRLSYYWERGFELEIDAPGGQAPALDYFLGRMDRWRIEGARVLTLGLTSVASAASIVLSMGDVGSRRALAGCRLLYHDVRIVPGANSEITRQSAAVMAEILSTMDAVHAARLAKHLFGPTGLPVPEREIDFDDPRLRQLELGFSGRETLTEDRFIEVYRALTLRERYISADQAQLLKLVDRVVAVAAA